MNLKTDEVNAFQKVVWDFYATNKRQLPWRNTRDPYKIAVAELMLQQTQVDRVLPKYNLWITVFPTWQELALAPLVEVIKVWQGLGYNRRARYAHLLAKEVVRAHSGKIPQDIKTLMTLPGIGPYTARAIAAFAFNQRVILIETNVRTVFLYHFFPSQKGVRDNQLLEYVERTLPVDNTREWYNALMDYGTFLKKQYGNQNKRSLHYKKQLPFNNSKRKIRGLILKNALDKPIELSALKEILPHTLYDIDTIILELEGEGLLKVTNGLVSLPN